MYFDPRLWAMTQGVRLRIAWAVLVGLAAVTAGIARLALLGWLIALVFQGTALAELLPQAGLVIAIMLARTGLEYYRTLVAQHTAAQVQARLRRQLYDKVAELGAAHFSQARTGAVILSLIEGVEQLEVYFGRYLPQLFVAALTPLLIFAVVAFVDLPIALIMLGFALVVLFAPALWHHLDSANSLRHRHDYSVFASEFLDSVQGLLTLKAFGQGNARARWLREKADRLFKSTVRVMGTNTLSRGITDTGIAVATSVAIIWGAYRVVDGEMELTALLIILLMGVEVFRPLRELRVLLHEGMIGLSAAQGIFQLLDAKTNVSAPSQASFDASRIAPTIAFDEVVFAYPGGRQTAHSGVSFKVAAGERIAVVGPSGAGKSTVAKLLLRFYDPQAGRLLIGNHPLPDFTFEQLHSMIALVSQEAYLFHGSVADNLRMGNPDATLADLAQAASAANAHEFITALPQGYDTLVGERGVRLSGGQRQRIAIARALLRDAPILILDEALSAIDAENEAAIQQALDHLMVGRTTLIFAHRLSSVINADRILVLNQGQISESGTHAELMAHQGDYYRLMAAQAQDSQDGINFDQHHELTADKQALPDGLAAAAISASDNRTETLSAWHIVRILLAMVHDYRGQLSVTFLLGIARVFAFIGVGVLSALIILAVKNAEPFTGLVITLAVVAPLAGILHWLESWLAHDMAYQLLGDMRIALFKKLDALAPAYLVHHRSGDILSIATHDIELIESFFAHTMTPALVAILVPTTVLATLCYFGWPMALALLPFLAYAALSPVLGRARIDALSSQARAAAGELNAHAVDSVQGLAEIIAYQQVAQRGAAFARKTQAFIDLRLPFLKDLARQATLQELAAGLGSLAVIVVGAQLVLNGQLDAGVLPLLTILATSAFLPISEIAQVGRQFADTLAATRRVFAVHSEPVAVQDGAGVSAKTEAAAPALELTQLNFRYRGRSENALADINLQIARGSTVALVGPSGAGKTTLANLLLRFWDPDSGTVKLDGHDLRDYQLDDLRRRIALVAQDTYLFNDTLRNNIMIADPNASSAQVEQAISKAALSEFTDTLPAGLDTQVGERGTQLSGGQRQRVAIARAFLKDAPLLILDEATSHLDAISEQAVREALAILMQGRTTIVIAHRLATVREADHIVVLADGRIVETGSHPVLLQRAGVYARMVSRQLNGALQQAV